MASRKASPKVSDGVVAREGLRLDEIVSRLGGSLEGDGSVVVTQVGALASAGPGEIAFLSDAKLRQQLQHTRAAAVIVPPQFAGDTTLPRIVYPNVHVYYARVLALLNPCDDRPAGVHPSAVAHSAVPASASVGENVVIGSDVLIGENVTLYPGCVLGDGVAVGDDSRLYPNVTVYDRCVIGRRAIVHAGAVIGSDGFGFAKEGDCWIKIPQIGRVIIGDDVEIGANTAIDRGALDDTVIGNGVKLDNQIHIAHNVAIGDDTAMAACVGIAGSTKFGKRCTVGGAGMIVGHIEIADDVHISGGTLISKSLREPGLYTSVFPFASHADWLQNAAQIRHLAKLAKRVSELEDKLTQMEKKS